MLLLGQPIISIFWGETMKIDNSLLVQLESLNKIELTKSERELARKDLQIILNYIDTLSELNTDGIEESASEIVNSVREDAVTVSPGREAIFQNAPNVKEEFLSVPKVIE